MGSGLDHLVAEGLISEVITRLKSGKEADVFIVRYGTKVVAAKVYKDRAHRSFKNNAAYKEGRQVRNTRSQRAMDKGSRFGKDTAEDAWKTAEVDALYKLHAASVRVPTPVIFLEGVLLMELVLDEEGSPAPRLIDIQLTPEQARDAYHDMVSQLVRILSCELIHGDLSPYNVLWGKAGPTIIDFPQIVSASHNSSSEQFFLRDARNILGFFASIDPSLQARRGDPAEIWRAYVRRELSADFRPQGRPHPGDRPERRMPAGGGATLDPAPRHERQGARGQHRQPGGPTQQGQHGESPHRGGHLPQGGNRQQGPAHGQQGGRGAQAPNGYQGGRATQTTHGQQAGRGAQGTQHGSTGAAPRSNRTPFAQPGAQESARPNRPPLRPNVTRRAALPEVIIRPQRSSAPVHRSQDEEPEAAPPHGSPSSRRRG